MIYRHVSVMPNEVVNYLNCRPGKIYVDCTLGGAGHARKILERISPDGILIGIDQDMDAIENAEKILKPYSSNIHLLHDNFTSLPRILSQLFIDAVDGIVLDLGLSLHHIEGSGRGFSFRKDEPLDMRMDIQTDVTAEDLVNTLEEDELSNIFFRYGEERWARRIARRIVKERITGRIRTSRQLTQIVCDSIPVKAQMTRRIHPATRVFMALRIAVNRELERIDDFMSHVAELLNPEGRLCVLTFHSLEDRIVKHRIRDLEKGCTCPPDFPVCMCGNRPQVRRLTRKPLIPSAAEIADNPMARSAKLRVMEKL
ncbi:MAG: 16S rRNA (cytosine(1402)-N(4))-methyltransferase RsmH [Desulfobacterales bacterium]|nr:16S rRNA (cytosine(1402)-N(4))-methyltransferase RsmH [Desulfobacterales bacterium]MDD4393012.1 16S rRNA (cytosine(1402)-N(4))-methyltransferase RsmH [Desulfobacterales bacterium]